MSTSEGVMETLFCLRGCEGLVIPSHVNLTNTTHFHIGRVAEACRVFTMTVNLTLLLLGIPGAVLSTIVTYKNTTKKSVASLLLIGNSVSSTIVLFTAVPRFTVSAYYLQDIPPWLCKTYSWIVSTFNAINVLSLLMLLMTRFMAVAFPHTLFYRLLGQNGLRRILAAFALTSVCSGRFLFSSWDNHCRLHSNHLDHTVVWVFVVVEFLVPVLVILALSFYMVALMKRTEKTTLPRHSMYAHSSLFMKITLTNCAWILLSNLPCVLHFSQGGFGVHYLREDSTEDDVWSFVRDSIADSVVKSTFFLRHAMDVLIYFAFSRRFRGGLAKLTKLHGVLMRHVPSYVSMETLASPGDSFRSFNNVTSKRPQNSSPAKQYAVAVQASIPEALSKIETIRRSDID